MKVTSKNKSLQINDNKGKCIGWNYRDPRRESDSFKDCLLWTQNPSMWRLVDHALLQECEKWQSSTNAQYQTWYDGKISNLKSGQLSVHVERVSLYKLLCKSGQNLRGNSCVEKMVKTTSICLSALTFAFQQRSLKFNFRTNLRGHDVLHRCLSFSIS